MIINEYGAILLNSPEFFEGIYAGKITDFSNIFLDSATATQFNTSKNINQDSFESIKTFQPPTISIAEFDKANQEDWFMPDEYKNMDIEGFLVNQCPEQNYERLVNELELFRQHNMLPLLRYLKYLVDTMREHNIVWGVGRGSSVASYCLYLLGVHKIDSIKYNLDIKEFLK